MIDPSRTVAELVLEQPSRSRVFEELGVDYCCGGKRSLTDACEARGIALGDERPELAELRDVFTALRNELEEHITTEEEELFPLVRTGGPYDAEQVAELEHDHESAGSALAKLRELSGGYDLDRALCNTHRATLDGLRELELDLHQHIHEENNVLFPRALAAA